MLRKPGRIAVPLLIAGFWIVMVGLFLYREYGGQSRALSKATNAPFVAQDQWMGIYLNEDHRVGHLRMRTDEESREDVPGIRLRVDAALETKLFGVVAAMDISGDAWSSGNGDQAEFDFALETSDTRMALQGVVADGRLRGTLDTGGEAIPLDFPVDSELMLGGGMGLTSPNMPSLQPGESTEIDAFDPMTMGLARATIRCVDEAELQIGSASVHTRIYETTLGSVTSRAWVADDEEVVQASTPFGFTLRKIDPAELVVPVETNADSDLIRSLAIVPTGKPVSHDLHRMEVRIDGAVAEKFPHDPPWQSREGDTLTLIQPDLPVESATTTSADFDPLPFLGNDPFVTTSHPTIQRQALDIVGDEANPWKQSVLLYQWVFDEIEKVPVLSVPNALDVLRTRAGDCNEHTVLYTALARSLGIPTRIAIGLVYSDTLGGFGYHAWPEVHIGDQWHPLDPTLGQLAADATHIKLFNGSIVKWIQLADFIGQIKMDVIATE